MNQSKFPYPGIFLTGCVVPDNLKTYEALLKERPEDKELQDAITFNQTFLPGTKYSRLVAHKLIIYDVKDWSWETVSKNYSFPNGRLEKVVEADLGIILKTAKESVREEIINENKVHYYPDGTFIRGSLIRLVSDDREIQTLEQFIEMKHDLKRMENQDPREFLYQFRIKKEELSYLSPKEFHFTEYCQINDIPYGVEKHFVVIMARHEKSSQIHFIQRKNSKNKKKGGSLTRG